MEAAPVVLAMVWLLRTLMVALKLFSVAISPRVTVKPV